MSAFDTIMKHKLLIMNRFRKHKFSCSISKFSAKTKNLKKCFEHSIIDRIKNHRFNLYENQSLELDLKCLILIMHTHEFNRSQLNGNLGHTVNMEISFMSSEDKMHEPDSGLHVLLG